MAEAGLRVVAGGTGGWQVKRIKRWTEPPVKELACCCAGESPEVPRLSRVWGSQPRALER